MNKADLKDLIDNELKRVKIKNHPHYTGWYETLKPYSRQIVDFILDEDLTPDYIAFAQEAIEAQLWFGSLRLGPATLHPLTLLYGASGTAMISTIRIPKP